MGEWINRLKSEAGTNKVVVVVLTVVVEAGSATVEEHDVGVVFIVLRGRPVEGLLQGCTTSVSDGRIQAGVAAVAAAIGTEHLFPLVLAGQFP